MQINKRSRGIITFLIGAILLLIIAVFSIQFYLESRIKNHLARKIPNHIAVAHKELNVNVLSGAVSIKNISGSVKHQNDSVYARFSADMLGLSGFSIWQFFINDKIKISQITLDKPILRISNNRTTDNNSSAKKSFELNRNISIGELQIDDGNIELINNASDNVQLRLNNMDLKMYDVRLDSTIINNKIPFTYEDYTLDVNDVFFKLNKYESLRIDALNIANRNLEISHLAIDSNYSKKELSTIIEKERDHISLAINEVLIGDLNFGVNDNRIFVTASSGVLKHPISTIYRDKLVADDLSKKRLYSQTLRELPIAISIKQLMIKNGQLAYEELVDADTDAGRIYFDQINADILGISNLDSAGNISINAEAMFMKSSPMTLEWSFDVNDRNDSFTAMGTFKDFNAESINPFLESNMRSRATGMAEEIYYTISGNGVQSKGDIKMKYRNFEFVILKKNRLGINKVLTAIGNIFIKENSKTDANGYRHGRIEVERDQTKSFFNYLWLNLKNGIGSTLIGNGEKE
ncbi:hypothetical protein [Aurantibacter sp.]|uniref:hypothetical protein n=1 Tax=Aurantibacter sp. TaxID=2807103 RepID=UPI003265625B